MIRDGKEVKLRRKQAIRWHRRMWNWIAEQYKNGSTMSVDCLKSQFLEIHKLTDVKCNCFGCEYVEQQYYSYYDIFSVIYVRPCNKCPINWKCSSNMKNNRCDLYTELDELTNSCYQSAEAYKLAKQIANLPANKGEAERFENDEV